MPRRKSGYQPDHNFERECETRVGEIRVKKKLTLRELAGEARCSVGALWDLTWGRTAPVYALGRRKGLVKGFAQRVCDALGVDPSEAFPLYVCGVDFRPDDDEGAAELLYGGWSLDSSRDPADICEVREDIQLLCGTMTKKEIGCVMLSASGDGLKEIGESLRGVSRARAGQILKQATAKAVHQQQILTKQERREQCQ